MQTIEEQVRALLNPVLGECVRQRTALGVKKYGQTLDHNHQPERAKAVHAVQEALDLAQYLLWMGRRGDAVAAAGLAVDLQECYGLTAEEIMTGGKT